MRKKEQPRGLKGWKEIAGYLAQPVATVQRWAKTGMPVRREGRFTVATPEELNRWLARESGEPVQIATESTDLAASLRRGLSHIRQQRLQKPGKPKEKPKR